ncbi:MAG: hypothetical protein ACJ787_01105, partial [Myxococcales bacterium]
MRPGALAADVACFAALAIACVWQLHDLERVLDLARWDEADYLRGGVSLLARGLPDAEWGPLHTVWYFAVSRLQPDRVALYYLSYRLLIVLPTLAIYVAGRRVGGSPIVSVALALLFAGSMAPHVVPRATLLAVLVVLVAIAAAARAGFVRLVRARRGDLAVPRVLRSTRAVRGVRHRQRGVRRLALAQGSALGRRSPSFALPRGRLGSERRRARGGFRKPLWKRLEPALLRLLPALR